MTHLNLPDIFKNIPEKSKNKTTTSLQWKTDLMLVCKDLYLDKKVLELGSSLGHTTRILSFLFKEVTAVDIKQGRHDISAKKINPDRTNIKYVVKDIYNEEWDFDKDTAVVIIDCIHDYEHIQMDILNCCKYFGPGLLIVLDDYGLFPDLRDGVHDLIDKGYIKPVASIGMPKGTYYPNIQEHQTLTAQEGIILHTL